MESDASFFGRVAGLFFVYWPYMGMVLGPVLLIASRFRWRFVFQSLGVLLLGISIGALVSRT